MNPTRLVDTSDQHYSFGDKPKQLIRAGNRLSTHSALGTSIAVRVGDQLFIADPVETNRHTLFMITLDAITNAAKAKFSALPEVQQIYRSVWDLRVYFYVFTSELVYNDALMDRLIDVELYVKERYPDIKQTYDFTALVLVSDVRYVTGSDAIEVYLR